MEKHVNRREHFICPDVAYDFSGVACVLIALGGSQIGHLPSHNRLLTAANTCILHIKDLPMGGTETTTNKIIALPPNSQNGHPVHATHPTLHHHMICPAAVY